MQIVSIQTGTARRVRIGERSILTAFAKTPFAGVATVALMGITGDEQADLSIHGGLEKAIYAYPVEHYAFWTAARRNAGVSPMDDSLPPGALGENLTLQGLLETDVWAGDILRFGNCELKVTLPREPCYKLNAAMAFTGASRLMAQTGFSGFYLSVLKPGSLRKGETFELLAGRRGVSMPQLFAAKRSKHLR